MIELLAETAIQEPQRIRGLEMPWNRVMGSTEAPARAARALGPWHPQEFMAECVETVPEAGGMMTFVFRRCDGAPLAFRPGQYVNVAFPVNGEDQDAVDRSYSLSSSPTKPWTFNITVKCDPTGQVSPWVHGNVKPGTVLDMLGPVGAFHLPDADRRARYLFLAAGAGITPIMSRVRAIPTPPGPAAVVVL
jgi:ferredoxin-NADP reductase